MLLSENSFWGKNRREEEIEVSSVADWLQNNYLGSVLDISKGRFDDEELEQLENLAKNGSFFDLEIIREKRRLPLSEWSLELKRILLGFEWMSIVHDGLVAWDVKNVDELSDQEIEEIFDEYRTRDFSYFLWQENNNMVSHSEKGNGYLREFYNVEPIELDNIPILGGENFIEEDSLVERERIRREYGYCKLSNDFGAVYKPNGQIDKCFVLDKKVEVINTIDHKENGKAEIGDIDFLLSNAIQAEKDPNVFLNFLAAYIQTRDMLPESLKSKIEDEFNFSIPKEWQREHITMDEAENYLKGPGHFLIQKLKNKENDLLNVLILELQKIKTTKKDDLAQRRFGCSMTDSSLSVLAQCISLRFMNNPTGDRHNTFARYLYDRKNLPQEMVQEFEEKFSVVIPDNLSNFLTFDDYLKVPNIDLENFLYKYYDRLPEMVEWLENKLTVLMQKIKDNKIKTEEISVVELVKNNLTQDLSEEDFLILVKNYQEMLSLPMRDRVEKIFNIKLFDLTVHEQIWFLQFMRHKNQTEVSAVKNKVDNFGIDFLRTFLSMEFDKGMGEKIILLSEKLEKNEMIQILKTYNKLVERGQRVDELVEESLQGNKMGAVDKKGVAYEILKRAKDLLSEASDKVETKDGIKELLSRLEDVKADLITFAAVFKNAFAKGQEIDFSQIKGLDLTIMDSGELNDQDKKQMRDIFKGNRTGVSPEFAEQRLKGEFDPVMSESGHKFYMLKKDGQIISFARFDELPNGNLYTGFINTAPDIKGMNIGSAFLETVFQREGREQAIELKVRIDNPAVKLYERFGFQIEGEPHEDSETKKVYFRMVRPPKAEELREAA